MELLQSIVRCWTISWSYKQLTTWPLKQKEILWGFLAEKGADWVSKDFVCKISALWSRVEQLGTQTNSLKTYLETPSTRSCTLSLGRTSIANKQNMRNHNTSLTDLHASLGWREQPHQRDEQKHLRKQTNPGTSRDYLQMEWTVKILDSMLIGYAEYQVCHDHSGM